jgi:hypothetical protein
MDIESAPQRFTKEGPLQTIERCARNPLKKNKEWSAARDPPDGQ